MDKVINVISFSNLEICKHFKDNMYPFTFKAEFTLKITQLLVVLGRSSIIIDAYSVASFIMIYR